MDGTAKAEVKIENGVITENTKVSLKLVITICVLLGSIIGWTAKMEFTKAEARTVTEHIVADTSNGNRIMDVLLEMKAQQKAHRWNTLQLIKAWNKRFPDEQVNYIESDDLKPK